MSVIVSTSRRVHSEFVFHLFLQSHRETDRFFELQEFSFHNLTVDSSTSTVRRSPLKSKVGNILTKATSLRRNLNIKDATPHVRLCGKFTTQPHVCHTSSKRAVLFFFN
jgi:hypothetical protein